MSNEQLFASFILDRKENVEIALQADAVLEATPLVEAIRPVPTSTAFLEGYMPLRKEVIPVVNLKKRLALADASYGQDAKVAVVQHGNRRYGLLFDDIRDVLRVEDASIQPLEPMLMTGETVVSSLIKMDEGRRIIEMLDLKKLFTDGELTELDENVSIAPRQKVYTRYVLFSCQGQMYGVNVEDTREICFFSELNEMFASGAIEGAVQIRGKTVPVLCCATLMGRRKREDFEPTETTRIIIMKRGDINFGLVVERVDRIHAVTQADIMPVPGQNQAYLEGVCATPDGQDIILVDAMRLIEAQADKIEAMARIRREHEDVQQSVQTSTRHIITEHSYLIFSIGKNFAIELRDVQEILDTDQFMPMPGANGVVSGIINLRGDIVPVVELKQFYSHYQACVLKPEPKLIIGKAGSSRVALLVDRIVTIYKQEQYHQTPSLCPELQSKQDTLDRLIEYINQEDLKEHVLVVNITNLLRNHLFIDPETEEVENSEQQSA